MELSWDPAKAASNVTKHGVAFEMVAWFEWSTAVIEADIRFDYPEPRLKAIGTIDGVLYSLIYTIERRSNRIISLRPASNREKRDYAEA
jgi:uncharacterized DUF497 family protein